MIRSVPVSGGFLDVRVSGSGPLVVLVPSLGRGASDFDALAADLASAGFRTAAIEPRGVAGTAPLQGATMDDFAADVAAVIRFLVGADGPAVVVGHALGNRVARLTATRWPDLVRCVVLLAACALFQPAEGAMADLRAFFDPNADRDTHLAAVRRAFFSPGNDPTPWEGGWYPLVALAQGRANRAMEPEVWWRAGSAPVLVVQPADDVIAPAANATRLAESIGERATVVTIADAGHALLPEQPEAVSRVVLSWLGSFPWSDSGG